MRFINNKAIRTWRVFGSRSMRAPASVSASCPLCMASVVFSDIQYRDISDIGCLIGVSCCPNCAVQVRFFCISENISDQKVTNFYLYPKGSELYRMPALPGEFPEPLGRAFAATIDAFNAGIYTATAVMGRRTLEGVFKYLLPEAKRNKPLAQLIEEAKNNIDLASPLANLSHAIRSGGNLGAHFDEEREPNAEVARKIVELLGYLIEYLYVLPQKISALEESLSIERVEMTGEY